MPKAAKRTTTEKPTTSVFGSAPIISTPAPAGKKKKAVEREITDLEKLAAVDATIKALEAMKKELERDVKAELTDIFVDEGLALKRRPENFAGVEGIGKASCQLRSSNSALTEEGLALCEANNIAVDKNVTREGTLIFNPAYAGDAKFLFTLEAKFGEAFQALQDERGPIVLRQDEIAKHTVSAAGEDAIFALSEEVLREILPYAFTVAIRPTITTGGDLRPALDIVRKMLPIVGETKPSKQAA